jgi:putative phosphotransacetylase
MRVNDGAICALRHIHLPVKGLKGLKEGDSVSVMTKGLRSIIFNNVKVRKGTGKKLFMHVDTDEGNAAGINKTGEGEII